MKKGKEKENRKEKKKEKRKKRKKEKEKRKKKQTGLRWFNVIIRTLVGEGSYSSVEKQSLYSTTSSADWASDI